MCKPHTLERIKKGVELCNKIDPKWYSYIDLDRFDMAGATMTIEPYDTGECGCVGVYIAGKLLPETVGELKLARFSNFIDILTEKKVIPPSITYTEFLYECGFTCKASPNIDSDYKALTESWREVIEKLQEAEK